MKNHHNNENTTTINKSGAYGSTAVVYDVLYLEYTFFWSANPERERRKAGVGFAIKTIIVKKLTEMPRPVSDRIMTMILPLSMDNFATIISVYVPTMANPDENKEAFNNHLEYRKRK